MAAVAKDTEIETQRQPLVQLSRKRDADLEGVLGGQKLSSQGNMP